MRDDKSAPISGLFSARFRGVAIIRPRSVVFRLFSQSPELLLQLLEIVIGELFQIDELIARAFDRADQLVQLEMLGFRVTVLGVLNQEHHQKCNDSRAGIDNKLPSVRKLKCWSGRGPN